VKITASRPLPSPSLPGIIANKKKCGLARERIGTSRILAFERIRAKLGQGRSRKRGRRAGWHLGSPHGALMVTLPVASLKTQVIQAADSVTHLDQDDWVLRVPLVYRSDERQLYFPPGDN
jgi:hypothetical protein